MCQLGDVPIWEPQPIGLKKVLNVYCLQILREIFQWFNFSRLSPDWHIPQLPHPQTGISPKWHISELAHLPTCASPKNLNLTTALTP